MPTMAQVKEARATADDTFCTSASKEFALHLPTFDGWVPDQNSTPVLLSLANVEPHDDPWVGHWQDEPSERRAFFWVLSVPKDANAWLGVGDKHTRLRKGTFVVFDDSVTHWVMSSKKWFGAAWQLVPAGVYTRKKEVVLDDLVV
jgi:hypothetical protein